MSLIRNNILKTLFVAGFGAVGIGCQVISSTPNKMLSVAELSREHERSRQRLDGREIIVRGYALHAAVMPGAGEYEGSITLGETGGDVSKVVCWFSIKEAAAFENVNPGSSITVKGVFNGESEAALRFCKLIKND